MLEPPQSQNSLSKCLCLLCISHELSTRFKWIISNQTQSPTSWSLWPTSVHTMETEFCQSKTKRWWTVVRWWSEMVEMRTEKTVWVTWWKWEREWCSQRLRNAQHCPIHWSESTFHVTFLYHPIFLYYSNLYEEPNFIFLD